MVGDLFFVTVPAWRPFLDPMPADGPWVWFAVPLILLVAFVYKTIRVERFETLWRETAAMSFQILLALLGLAFAIWAVASVF